MKYAVIIVALLICSCKNRRQTGIIQHQVVGNTVDSTSIQPLDEDEKFDYQESPFEQLKSYPVISDTAAFIDALKKNCHITNYPFNHLYETIDSYKKLSIFGSSKHIYLIEYNYHDGSSASFPWKKQLIFNTAGKLLKIFTCLQLEPVQIFTGKKPFLMALSSTAKGNGWHEVFRLSKNTLEQVYDGFLGYRPQTYSTGYFNYVTEPNELKHMFSDINKDGFEDIVFYGKLRYSKIDLGVNDKTIPVKYIFLYRPENGHFIEREDYSKKYEFIYGNTK